MDTPKVSVLLTVYNGERFLEKSIESILNQTLTDFEFIIVDDGSTDKTSQILAAYVDQDPRIVLLGNEENLGRGFSLNKGLFIAKGKYIAPHDADDISLPERLEKEVNFLDDHPKVVLVSGNIEHIDWKGNFISRSQLAGDSELVAWHMLFFNYVGYHTSVMYRLKPALARGGYLETYGYCKDYELYLNLQEIGDIAVLSDILVQGRYYDESLSARFRKEQIAEADEIARNNISRLIGETLSLDKTLELKKFWSHNFPDSYLTRTINRQLKRIYKAFLLQRVQQRGASFVDLSSRLRTLIGEQFLVWAADFKFPHQILPKLKVSFYAFRWSPSGALGYWLAGIKKVIYRIMGAQVKSL